jgi:hypothetical protein
MPPFVQQDISSKYYHCHSYTWIAKLFNAAFTAAWSDLDTQFKAWYGGATPPSITAQPVQMQYIADGTNTFAVLMDTTAFGTPTKPATGGATEGMRLFLNSNAYNLLHSLPVATMGTCDPLFAEVSQASSTLTQLTDPATGQPSGPFYLVVRQEWAATEAWAPYTGMSLRSTGIPARTESGGTSAPGATITGNLYDSVFHDFDFGSDSAHSATGEISFAPTQYRWIALRGSGPLNSIDFNVLLRHRSGQLVPLQMAGTGSTILVKLLFRKSVV